jgi:hypothetical protein
VDAGKTLNDAAYAFGDVEIVRQSDSMSALHFDDLMLTIAVKRCPLDFRCPSIAPIIDGFEALVADDELAAWLRLFG